jgi:DNA-binding response OmpR family regulator
VSSPHQTSDKTPSQPNILLLEGYDPLAAALGSALKKFAPQGTVSIATSLAEAEKVAAQTQPQLFVIDVDPPWAGLTDFLEKMRTAHADAQALIVGAAIPAEISAESKLFGGLEFIEKPFELAAFGAAVQASVGPRRKPEAANRRGNLSAVTAIDIVLVHCAARADVVVNVDANANNSGEIHIAGGQISYAETGPLRGTDALRQILLWPDARVSEAKKFALTHRSVLRGWPGLVVEALRTVESMAPAVVLPKKEVPPVKPQARTGKKIVVIDDTEMLLIFAEDALANADPELQIVTALTGIDGLKQIKSLIPDLVLLDYSLPDLNGDEICRRLLEDERMARIPVLMMSGHIPEMTAAAARFENVVATIEKPFLSDALIHLVQQTLAAGPRMVRAKNVPAPKAETILSAKAPLKPAQDRRPSAPKAPPVTAPPPQELEIKAKPSAISRVPSVGQNDAVLGLFLEVLSMQLTPQLQMGTIRARPASFTVSLHLPSAASRNAIPAETGFQLGPTELNGAGQISTVHLIPTSKPFQPAQTRNAFEIGGVAVVPNDTRARVQLTPAGTTPMTMHLLAHLELAAVELSPTFQVARLVLKWRTNTVRVTLDPKAQEQNGASFEAASIKLDGSARIVELLLNPIK